MENTEDQDKKVILEQIESDPYFNIYNVSEEWRNDPEVVLAFIKKFKDAHLIEYAGDSLKNDKDFLLQAAQYDESGMGLYMVLKHAGPAVREDKELFMKLLQRDGHFYVYMSDSLKKDPDLKLISAISIIGNKFVDVSGRVSFEYKINRFLDRVKNGVRSRGEDRNKPYSFRIELENYNLWQQYRPGIDDECPEQDVFVQESPEEIKRQIDLLEHIREITLDRSKTSSSKLQQREAELSALEAEAARDAAKLKEFESKDGQSIGE